MGLFKKLKKVVKKVRKGLGLPALTVGNTLKAVGGIAVPGGALGAVAGSVLRSKLKSAAIGGGKHVIRSKAARALVDRVVRLAPPTASASAAQTMPGGAPLSSAAERRNAKTARAVRSRRPKAAPRGKASKPRRRSSGRKPPTGGLNLKALSASWKAAGKPGRWIDWVKANGRA